MNECTFRLDEGNVERHARERVDSFLDRPFYHHIITYSEPIV